MEEARREHLKKLQQRRVRFRSKRTTVNDTGENGSAISNESIPQCRQSYRPNRFNVQTNEQVIQNNPVNFVPNPKLPPKESDNMHTAPSSGGHMHPFYRHYSLSSYQPAMFLPGYPVPMSSHHPFYYMPPNGNVPIFSHPRLRNYLGSESVIPRDSEVHREQPNDDDDDVFSTGTNPPCALQDSQNRKRAHSAGDMGLLRPPHPTFTHGANYPGLNPEICEPLAKKVATRVSFHPTTYNPTYPPNIRPPPPPYPSCYRETPTNIMSTRPKPSENHSRNPEVIDPLAQRKIVQNSIYSTNQSSSHQVIHDVPEPKTGVRVLNKEENESTKKSDPTSKGTESTSNPKPEASNKSSLTKKSNLLSRPHAVKKKVLWNDLDKRSKSDNTNKEPKSSNQTDDLIKEEDLKKIKSNPSKYTKKNRIGPFLIGPLLGNCAVKCISQYLVRREGTAKYYTAKVCCESNESIESKSGKMLLHTEHSLLSLLSSHPGVIRQHGMFKDCSYNSDTGEVTPRVGLVVGCLVQHERSAASQHYVNLLQHVIQVKRLSERETLRIFHSLVTVIVSLHKINVVHRDLKLNNMVLDKRTRQITLTNFCLGCHLQNERELLTDQRGSPAYISPDVLSDKPYAGKPSDMWSLGVVLYTILYGRFPFYDQAPKKLFAKIKSGDYSIPSNGQVSANTNEIIRGLLTLNPLKRATAAQALDLIESSVATWCVLRAPGAPAQVVPDVDNVQLVPVEKKTLKSADHEKLMTYAFYQKMLSDDENDDDAQISTKIKSCSKLPPSLPEICHVGFDARPLNHEEMRLHQRLLPSSATNHVQAH